ncbi:DUF362 domain-containing protein [Sulfurospirillum arcachonense]|uniref:DUF362 domain-containing protein n=1 Tax=Sulfurospirillum arcachonense TaxID=57666 RepID=UPI0004684CBB|nr:4Fe-4S binding protein [Sulfurospirillum arcachonense]
MSKEEYIQRAGFFTYDRLSCLRNEYAHNDCKKCLEICPENAFVFVRKKLTLETKKCTSCGVCIGSCPTGSLFLVGQSVVKPIQKMLYEDNPMLSCENQQSCLAKYTQFDYITMALESQKSFTCNLFTCKDCEINTNQKVQSFIEKNIDEANVVLEKISALKVKKSFEIETKPLLARRAFFRSLIKPLHVKDEIDLHVKSLDRVKKSLKENLLDVNETVINQILSFSHQKKIDESCTNCGECVTFCPSEALNYDKKKTKIFFQMGKCIGCGICEDICKTQSIKSQNVKFDLIDFAYDKIEVLCEHELRVCKVCKCAFSYKSGEEICQRCSNFEVKNSNMLALASNIK